MVKFTQHHGHMFVLKCCHFVIVCVVITSRETTGQETNNITHTTDTYTRSTTLEENNNFEEMSSDNITSQVPNVKNSTDKAPYVMSSTEKVPEVITTETITTNPPKASTSILKVLSTKDNDLVTTQGASDIQSTTSSTNVTVAVIPPDGDNEGSSGALIGIILGVLIAVILVIGVIILIIILIKRKKSRERNYVTKVENPQYSSAPSNYRFSRDSGLYVGPTVNFQKLNNNVHGSDEKKKRPAPAVPSSRQGLLRKKAPAPPPPNPFGAINEDEEETVPNSDMFEKDSNASSENLEMSTFTAKNEASYFNTPKMNRPEDTKLQENDPNKDSENIGNGKVPSDHEDNFENEENCDQSEALISNKEKTGSKGNVSEDISLDEYDKKMNPFFAD